jgi:hypothetical protein
MLNHKIICRSCARTRARTHLHLTSTNRERKMRSVSATLRMSPLRLSVREGGKTRAPGEATSEPGTPRAGTDSATLRPLRRQASVFRFTDKITFGGFIIYCANEISVSMLINNISDDITFTVSSSDKLILFLQMLSNI